MTRFNLVKSAGPRDCVVWGKTNSKANISNANTTNNSINHKQASVLFFGALLIVCSLAVGCNNDKPKPVSTTAANPPVSQNPVPVSATPAPTTEAASKPAPKKVVKKRPANVTYAESNYGVSFEYPRRYALETGDAAMDVVRSSPLPMNFVQPGGVALAAVELPMTGFANTDFSSAFFNVSVNKSLTAESCGEFSVMQPAISVTTGSVNSTASATDSSKAESSQSTSTAIPVDKAVATTPTADSSQKEPVAVATSTSTVTSTASQNSKLMLGKLELQGTETAVADGNKNTEAKYFHVYQNGACYEFGLNVTTTVPDKDDNTKLVDRKQVFNRLEKILATVKIAPVEAVADVTASTPATEPSTPPAPAQ